jgi:hypothetical protein
MLAFFTVEDIPAEQPSTPGQRDERVMEYGLLMNYHYLLP